MMWQVRGQMTKEDKEMKIKKMRRSQSGDWGEDEMATRCHAHHMIITCVPHAHHMRTT